MKKITLLSTMIFACIFSMAQTATTDPGVVINGIKWATRNVDKPGTFAAKPEDPGMFYQWNNNMGWSFSDPLISSTGETEWTQYGSDAETWETSNNVCPAGWRIPTNEELTSLANSGSEWTDNGRVFGSGNSTVFLPVAGMRNNSSGALFNAGSFGYYWSSTVSGKNAYLLYFGNTVVTPGDVGRRTSGFSVRCVAK